MDYLVSVVILLGVLVAIHEFGHFIVAKAFGIRVETFSIGMGKKIVKFTRGETEYALSLIPLGGYVKLTGQDPREEITPDMESRSFRHKPLYQRACVVLAGPIFNAVLAAVVMITLYKVGIPVQSPVIARVLPGSTAEKVGFKAGDTVTEITKGAESHTIREYSDLENLVGESVGQELIFKVAHAGGAGTANIGYTPVLGLDRDSTLGVMKSRGIIEGVERGNPDSVLGIRGNSWAADKQIPFGFRVSELSYAKAGAKETIKVDSFQDLEKAWNVALAEQKGNSGEIIFSGHKVLPEGTNLKDSEIKPVEATHTLSWVVAKDRPPTSLEAAGILSGELFVIDVKENSPAAKLGLKKGDEVVSINGEKVLSFNTFRESIQKKAATGNPLEIDWIRDGKKMKATITPEVVRTTDPQTEAKKDQFQIGTAFLAIPAPPAMNTLKVDFVEATQLGLHKTYQLTTTMLYSFYLLATGEISPKTLGGPILIGKIAGESFRQGWVSFFRTMAFISLNLFILNLLPIPVLDGGHLLLYTIEAIRRKPLSTKIVEMWTTAGFFLLMSLVAVVFFNDLSRLGLFKFLNL